jgi:dockerin type I repeat protein
MRTVFPAQTPQRLKPKFVSPYRRPKGLLHPAVVGKYAKTCLVIFCGVFLIFGPAPAQQRKFPPDYEKKRAAIAGFEAGVVPLFLLGDLNEDGNVDEQDLKLLRAYATQKSSAGISCLAAADLDENRVIDQKDAAILEQILKKGKVAAPALSSRSGMGCDYRNFFIAARPGTAAGGAVPIHFLDPRFNPQNSSVTLTAGQATVSAGRDEFVVRVPAGASGTVTVAISVPGPRRYFYTFPVWAAEGR